MQPPRGTNASSLQKSISDHWATQWLVGLNNCVVLWRSQPSPTSSPSITLKTLNSKKNTQLNGLSLFKHTAAARLTTCKCSFQARGIVPASTMLTCALWRLWGYFSLSLPQPYGAALSWGRPPDKRRRSHTWLPARTAATGPGPDALSAAGWTSSLTAPWLENPAGACFNGEQTQRSEEALLLLVGTVIKGLSSSKLFQVEGISTQILQLGKDNRWGDNPTAHFHLDGEIPKSSKRCHPHQDIKNYEKREDCWNWIGKI